MITRQALVRYLGEYLACDKFTDYAPNGLQIEGTETIGRLATAVSASADVIQQAIAWKADALLVHHGYFWKGESPVIVGMKKQRIEKILKNNLNLLAYHLPLDCHTVVGNNACIAKLLAVEAVAMHKVGATPNLLWSGKLTKPMDSSQFTHVLDNTFQQKPLHIPGHTRTIQHIAWCSGAAQDFIVDASVLGVDAYLSGEISERTYYQAKELNIDYYACGHHATERFGVQALGEHLASSFEVEHVFFDSANPY